MPVGFHGCRETLPLGVILPTVARPAFLNCKSDQATPTSTEMLTRICRVVLQACVMVTVGQPKRCPQGWSSVGSRTGWNTFL